MNNTEIIIDDKKGKCVIATRNIKKGTVIFENHVTLIPIDEVAKNSTLYKYVFEWSKTHYALAMGDSSLINHSKVPNITWFPMTECNMIQFKTIKDIKKGHELVFDYGNYGNNFKFRPLPPLKIKN